MNQFDMLRPQQGHEDETMMPRHLNMTRAFTLGGAMMLAGSFWWFLGRLLLGI